MPDWLNKVPVSTEGWPTWAANSAPIVWKALLVLAASVALWIIAALLRRLLAGIGKRRVKEGESFEGSVWDIAASLLQFGALMAGLPLVLGVAGVSVTPWVEKYAGGSLAALIILGGAYLIARTMSRAIRRFGEKAHRGSATSDPLFGFVATLLFYGVMAVALIFALQQVGFNANSLVAVVGAAGLAIALALQDTLKAVAAGVWLATYKPFRIGDWVYLAGVEGEITEISPFRTTVKTVDNKMIAVPNEKAWGDNITNFTRYARRRLDLQFDISYDDDIDHALRVVRETTNSHPRVLAKDETWTGVNGFAASSVLIRLRAWVPASEIVQVRADIYRMMKYAFDREGITIPYPHQVELIRTEGEPGRGRFTLTPDAAQPAGEDR